jgi:hypothetical protein
MAYQNKKIEQKLYLLKMLFLHVSCCLFVLLYDFSPSKVTDTKSFFSFTFHFAFSFFLSCVMPFPLKKLQKAFHLGFTLRMCFFLSCAMALSNSCSTASTSIGSEWMRISKDKKRIRLLLVPDLLVGVLGWHNFDAGPTQARKYRYLPTVSAKKIATSVKKRAKVHYFFPTL